MKGKKKEKLRVILTKRQNVVFLLNGSLSILIFDIFYIFWFPGRGRGGNTTKRPGLYVSTFLAMATRSPCAF